MKDTANELMDEMLKELDRQPLKFMARPKDITVEKLFPIGNYLNIRIGMTWSVGDENPNDVMNAALNIANQFHKEHYPHLYNEDGSAKYEMYKGEEPTKKVTTIEENEPLTPLEKMKLAINSCTDITVLESFKLLVSKNKEGLQETYDNKLKQLTK